MMTGRDWTVTQDSRAQSLGTSGPPAPLRVLVITVVHDPDDARIRYRQLGALLESGARVTYAAPFTAYHRDPPPGVTAIDLPRAVGRHRIGAVRAARRLLHTRGPLHDVALLHDPELLLAVPGLDSGSGHPGRRPQVIWDVHEDTEAALGMKGWLPRRVRPLVALGIRASERWAEEHCGLILAEESYRTRFRHPHPVVPNSVIVPLAPPPAAGADRVVYLGRLTGPRGTLEMIELGRRLSPEITVDLIGPADADISGALARAHRRGWVRHHGFVPNREALGLLGGALAGLALLRDEPNYATSRPTKVMEYMAFGVPVVTTPNAASAELVTQYGSGLVVPFEDPAAAVEAVLSLRADVALRQKLSQAGRDGALRDLDWRDDGRRFGELIRSWADRR
jgi:glycosyltransferase involved in cell wall biosynthesis